jgi:hypothetical protein
MTKKPHPLAAGLDEVVPSGAGGAGLRIVNLFGDQPEVLDAIRRARRDRKLSFAAIAKFLTVNGDHPVSSAAVQTWLAKEGIA